MTLIRGLGRNCAGKSLLNVLAEHSLSAAPGGTFPSWVSCRRGEQAARPTRQLLQQQWA